MKSRGAEFDALLTPIERMVRMARYWGERAPRLSDQELDYAMGQASIRWVKRLFVREDFEGENALGSEDELVKNQRAYWFQSQHIALSWFRSGLPKVSIGAKHAAALACTRMPPDATPDLRLPWNTFAIDVPEGLHAELFHCPLRQIFVHVDDRSGDLKVHKGKIHIHAAVDDQIGGAFSALPLPATFVDDVRQLAERAIEFETDEHFFRSFAPVCNLILGVIAELNQPREAATIERSGSKPRTNRRGEPIVTTFALARDIKVDCRAALREYVSGARGSSPTVQSLVRGHWKKQPCGAARSDRKLIFVEPYWRGPETAPIALRAHVVGQEKEVGRE